MTTKKVLPASPEEDDDTRGAPPGLLDHSPQRFHQRVGSRWRMIQRWLVANTFTFPGLPVGWYARLAVYLAAVAIQVLIVSLVMHLSSAFSFAEVLALLVVLLVSFVWGAVAGILATLIGAVLLLFMLPSSVLAGSHVVENDIGIFLYVLLGLAVSMMASQAQQARMRASIEQKNTSTVRQQLRDMLLESPIPISVVLGPEHRFEVISPLTQRTAGKRPLLGLPLREAFPEYASQGIFELLDQVYTTGQPLTVPELRVQTLQHDDNSATPIEQYFNVVYQPLRTSQGTVEGIAIFNIDITDQVHTHRQMELLMHEREQERDQLRDVLAREQHLRTIAENATRQLQTVVDVLPVGVIIADTNGRLLLRNSATFRVWGGQAPEVISIADYQSYRGWWTTTGEPLAPGEWGLARAIAKGEVSLGEEIDIATFDGERKTILHFAAPILDEQGAITGGVAAFLDITQRRHLEQQTRESLQALLVLAEALVSLPTSKEESKEVTSGVLALAGVSKRLVALIRSVLNCKRVSITVLDPRTQELRSAAVVGLSPEQERLWRERRPGFHLSDQVSGSSIEAQFLSGNVVVLDMGDPLFASQPNPYGIKTMLLAPMHIGTRLIGVLALDHGGEDRSFTEGEKSLARAVAELAALILERERLLEERAESQANVLALQQANQLKDEFIGIAGHELRTPLTTIKASVQLATRQMKRLHILVENSSPEIEKLLSAVQTHLDRAERQLGMQNRLVNDLLDMSRIETGRLELHLALTDLGALVRDIVADQRILTPERSILCEQNTTGEVLVLGDADRLRQVVTNYLSNALKYSMVNQPVRVGMIFLEGQVRVEIEDKGPGLSEDQQQRIWERFYRVPGIEVKSGSGVGLGLGLHISKMIIERHGGKVGVQSMQGHGSTFWLTLPLAE